MIKSPRGTQDILPADWPWWRHVIGTAEQTARESGYARIETPMFENTALFTHATGEHTDVNREMYTFRDKGGDELSLRPEGTASVFRAYFEQGMKVWPQPVKLYYVGSMFRYERPQKGRVREHHQFGCEAIGSEDALVDASLVSLQDRFYRAAGTASVRIQANTIGDENCRPGFLQELVEYLRSHESGLCRDCRERIDRNPLRVLDCKVESCQPVLDGAPRMIDRLCEPCRVHWDRFQEGIAAVGLAVETNPRLVRGLDYYTRTVWEFLPRTAGGAQSVLGGGGRYDALAKAIGAPAAPGVGFSTGLERVLLNIDPDTVAHGPEDDLDVYVATMGGEAELRGLALANDLWNAGLRADMGFGGRSLGTQLKQANGRGARVVAIIGEREVEENVATLRDFASGTQQGVTATGAVEAIRAMLATAGTGLD